MKRNKKRSQKKPRSIEALTAILHCKGGKMRDKRERRLENARHEFFKSEEW